MTKLTELTLDTVARGASAEVFQHEFEKVLESIQDPNTDPEAVRKITLTFKFEPHKSREEAKVTLIPKVELAPMAPIEGHMFVGRRDGRTVAATHDTTQEDLGLDRDPRVTPIGAGQKSGS